MQSNIKRIKWSANKNKNRIVLARQSRTNQSIICLPKLVQTRYLQANTQNLLFILTERNIKVTFIWLPGHTTNIYTEFAHTYAKIASSKPYHYFWEEYLPLTSVSNARMPTIDVGWHPWCQTEHTSKKKKKKKSLAQRGKSSIIVFYQFFNF